MSEWNEGFAPPESGRYEVRVRDQINARISFKASENGQPQPVPLYGEPYSVGATVDRCVNGHGVAVCAWELDNRKVLFKVEAWRKIGIPIEEQVRRALAAFQRNDYAGYNIEATNDAVQRVLLEFAAGKFAADDPDAWRWEERMGFGNGPLVAPEDVPRVYGMFLESVLAPCPFCGGEAVFEEIAAEASDGVVWSVGCIISDDDAECFGRQSVGSKYATKAEAAAAWNTRAGGWRTIESAPRDGTHVLVTDLSGKDAGFGTWNGVRVPWCAVVHWWAVPGESGFYLSSGAGDLPPITRATHWRSLP